MRNNERFTNCNLRLFTTHEKNNDSITLESNKQEREILQKDNTIEILDTIDSLSKKFLNSFLMSTVMSCQDNDSRSSL